MTVTASPAPVLATEGERAGELLLSSLFPIADLEHEIREGWVREQTHPDDPRLQILNYTDSCAYEGHWNPVTLACRGLIVHSKYPEATVAARPWPKFFNYGQDGAPALDPGAHVEVTDKQDGSLGILYWGPDGPAIATRGSFASPQARHGTELLHQRYWLNGWAPDRDWTYLFEVIFPENRIVLDYGDQDDLVLLGAVHTSTGEARGPDFDPSWPGPRTAVLAPGPWTTLGDALALPPRENAEGVVVREVATGAMVKIKQADYVALHRIITNTSARRIWEHLAVEHCSHLIEDPQHWGSYIGLDPARAAECQAAGNDWLDRMLDGVPDEFYAWVKETVADLLADYDRVALDIYQTADEVADLERRDAFAKLADNPHQKVIMRLLNGRSHEAQAGVTRWVWRCIEPNPTLPFARSEDVA